MNDFGNLLRRYRRRGADPEWGGDFSQARLGELLGLELGTAAYTSQSVSNWERGENRIDKDKRLVLLALLQILHRGGGLSTIEEANALLQAGNYRSLNEAERQKIFSTELTTTRAYHRLGRQAGETEPERLTPGQPIAPWPHELPGDDYYPLPGRERDLENLLNLLGDSQGPPIIAVDGLGGLGKTALATELGRRALRQKRFEGLLGDSAKQESLTGGQIIPLREATLDFAGLLDTLIRQLKCWEWLTLKTEEKRMALASLFSQHRYLILVDNLETAENANALVMYLRNILGQSRAIVTSRKQVPHDFVHSLSLTGLPWEDAFVFMRADAARRRAQQLLCAPQANLVKIHALTGGAPLAMKLVVAQARFLNLAAVLQQSQEASGQLYPFIFRQSWEQLSPEAQRILIYIGRTVVTTVSWEELVSVAGAEREATLTTAVEQLIAYSLLNVSHVGEQMRYGLHQLTRQFVNSDLPDRWGQQGLL